MPSASSSRKAPAHPSAARRPKLLSVAFRVVALLVPLGLLLIVAEVGVRLLIPSERWRVVDATHHWQIDPALGWVQQPNLDSYTIDVLTNEAIPLRTNGDGLLPPTATPRKPPEMLRVLLVGDSTIVGAGVHERERIHSVLAELLAERDVRVDVVNAGTQGFATDQAALRLEQLIGPYDPDVVLHCVCSNDFVANTLQTNHGLTKPSFRLDDGGGLVANPFTPSEDIPQMGSGIGGWIQHSAVYRLARPRLIVLRARLGGWEARNLIGVASDWYYDAAALERVDWPLFGALVQRMNRTASDHGALFAVYLHPDAGSVWDPVIQDTTAGIDPSRDYDRFALERRAAAELERRDVRFVPLVAYFAQRQERGPFHLLPRDPHCNAEGYRMQAERLAEFLSEEALSSPTPTGSDRSAPAVRQAPPKDPSASASGD